MNYQRHPEVSCSEVGERLVLVDPRDDRSIVLNSTGSTLWQHLFEPRQEPELVQVLQQAYPDLSPEQAGKDVRSFLEQLSEAGLLLER